MKKDETGTYSCHMSFLPFRRLPKLPVGSPHMSSCSAKDLRACWTSPRRPGRSNHHPPGLSLNMYRKCKDELTIIRELLQAAQTEQHQIYNCPAQPRESKPRDCILLRLPNCKFLACWQGPYTIIGRVGPVKYRLQQPGKCASTHLYHINLLKCLIEPVPALIASSVPLPGFVEWVHIKEDLTLIQQ